MDIQGIIIRAHDVVDSHRLAEGAYCRWLWQSKEGQRELGVNPYGCADAANILYTIGDFPGEPAARAHWISALQAMQEPATGLFHEATHHPIHTTAHCTAALELFDARPLNPFTALMPYLDRERLYAFLDGLDWAESPWNNSHQGAGLYAALAITRACDRQWQNDYFDWLRLHNDPETGLGVTGHPGSAPLSHQLFGWFHYLFNHEYAHRPIPHPERLLDSCISLYTEGGLPPLFGRNLGFMEIDWVFAMNRASRQTPHRFHEVKALLRDFAGKYVDYLYSLDAKTDDDFNDLHKLFGVMCALAELQLALPGELESDVPLKLVLDRRPFI